jgi:DNA topoisomerase-1
MAKKKVQLISDPQEAAEAANLVYVSDEEPGIRRRRSGKGFRYISPEGKPIKDKATLERVKSLAIPPAYTDVWISPLEDGHIQATGRDAKGRKQYRYHPRWAEVRDQTKFHRMRLFGEALPAMRERIAADMRLRGLPREKVLATVVQLLGTTFIRIGNPEYVKANDSFGLTTLLDNHVEIEGKKLSFEFRGKSGKEQAVSLTDKRLARIVKQCQDVPGQQLFQYIDDQDVSPPVTSSDVNDYIREVAGSEFTAKDFRTWGGTTLAVMEFYELGPCDNDTQLKKNTVQMIKSVSDKLGNTQAVCRKYYVHPAIAEAYSSGELLTLLEKHRAEGELVDGLYPEERTVMALLREYL